MWVFVVLVLSVFAANDTYDYLGDPVAFRKEYFAKYNNTVVSPIDLRVSKAMVSKGYTKVRLSVITQSGSPPSGIAWEIAEQFHYKWTSNYLYSAVVDVSPGGTSSFTINGAKVDIKIPKQNGATRGILFADPCISYSTWCKYANRWSILDRTTTWLNTVMAEDGMDFWYIVGDNLYDMNGDKSKSFFDRLSLTAKSKVNGMVLGNHDYWIGGSPGNGQWGDQLGIGMTQWWAQDTVAGLYGGQIFDWSINPSNRYHDSKPPLVPSNNIWWNQLGNIGFIGYSGAFSWNDYSGYFDQACQQFSTQNPPPSHILLLGHWDGQNLGCQYQMDAPSVLKKLQSMPSCSALKYTMHYVDGHKHCNQNHGDGWMIGGNGMSDCGQFGHLYYKSEADGSLKVWYFEFASESRDNWNSIYNCVSSKGIDGCLNLAKLYYDSGPPLSPGCLAMLDKMATDKSGSYTCGDRINYLESHDGLTWRQAYDEVRSEFPSVCVCDVGPTPKPTPAPPAGNCDDMLNRKATDSGGTYTCGQRIDYLEKHGMTEAQAYAEVAKEFPTICICDNPPSGGCTTEDGDPWASHSYAECCSGLQKCLKDWGSGTYSYRCERPGYYGCH